jgi:hypothetical protein
VYICHRADLVSAQQVVCCSGSQLGGVVLGLAEVLPALSTQPTSAVMRLARRGPVGGALHGALARAAQRGLHMHRTTRLQQTAAAALAAAATCWCVLAPALPALRLALLTYRCSPCPPSLPPPPVR